MSHSVEIYGLANNFGFRPGVRSVRHSIEIEPISQSIRWPKISYLTTTSEPHFIGLLWPFVLSHVWLVTHSVDHFPFRMGVPSINPISKGYPLAGQPHHASWLVLQEVAPIAHNAAMRNWPVAQDVRLLERWCHSLVHLLCIAGNGYLATKLQKAPAHRSCSGANDSVRNERSRLTLCLRCSPPSGRRRHDTACHARRPGVRCPGPHGTATFTVAAENAGCARCFCSRTCLYT